MSSFTFRIAIITVTLGIALARPSLADAPSVAQALRLVPIQSDIDFDKPTAAETAKCTLKVESTGRQSGWTVRMEDETLLRRFIDTNDDNKVDLWCYFQDGVEVYRDIDADFNGKADQYRWLGTAGMRWGLDRDEDGEIDSWKVISAEEVSSEIVAALRQRDAARFNRLLLSPAELARLGVGSERKRQLAKQLEQAREDFASLAKQQKTVSDKTVWLHFGATLPGVVPMGTDGATKDIHVYENVVAVIETEGQNGQVPIGTLVLVDGAWRTIDLPVGMQEGQANAFGAGFFFASSRNASRPSLDEQGGSEQWQKWIKQLEVVDQELLKVKTPDDQGRLNAQRANVIEKLIESLPADQRETWIKQFADTVSAAVQSGQYSDGVDRLKKFYEQVEREVPDKQLRAYVKFRYISADYGQKLSASINDPKADMAAIQKQWLKDLADYATAYPETPDAAEAMLQLAIAEEFAGNDTAARRWYQSIVADFPDDRRAAKARGALTRLDSVGKVIGLRGTTTTGQSIDLTSYRGKVVLIHYWATWCEPCKEELKLLEAARVKYESKGLRLIGVSLDSDAAALKQFLQTQRLTWPQIHDEGGLDGRLANELGILTLPTMLLIGEDGKVAERSLHAAELDGQVGELLK